MDPITQKIARQHLEGCHVGQEALPEEGKPWIIFDPEWARLKRMYVLKDNFYKLYAESQKYAPEPLKTEVKQAYVQYRTWMKPYKTWTDVAFSQFPKELYKQTRRYNQIRKKVVDMLNRNQQVSETAPGDVIAQTPPQQLSDILTPAIDTKIILIGLAALWIFLNRSNKT
ncbi:MAG: hypothetical protein ACYSWP_14980 [Planctomycetota bacterium]|jgi:hypothetical protein